jgi:hypothetical protein
MRNDYRRLGYRIRMLNIGAPIEEFAFGSPVSGTADMTPL